MEWSVKWTNLPLCIGAGEFRLRACLGVDGSLAGCKLLVGACGNESIN